MTRHNRPPTRVGEGTRSRQRVRDETRPTGVRFCSAAGLGPSPPAGTFSPEGEGDNLHGRRGVELTAADKAGSRSSPRSTSSGAGTFGWKEVGFAFDLPAGTKTLTLGLGSSGTGDSYFAETEFRLREAR